MIYSRNGEKSVADASENKNARVCRKKGDRMQWNSVENKLKVDVIGARLSAKVIIFKFKIQEG